MYNSVIGYAFKIIKGNMFFSVIMFIIISQLMVVNSIFSLVWKYEILIQQEINFFRQFSIYSLYIFIFILSFLLSTLSSIYIFSRNRRMFSTLRIFGSNKSEVRRLYSVLSLLYPLISLFICIIEDLILYIRYRGVISNALETIEMSDIFSGAFLILCANIVLILFFMFGAFITNSILLNRDPYEDLRGTLWI